jgi:hypothetical protein
VSLAPDGRDVKYFYSEMIGKKLSHLFELRLHFCLFTTVNLSCFFVYFYITLKAFEVHLKIRFCEGKTVIIGM